MALNVLLVPSMGITGAAIATATSIVVLFSASLITVKRIHGLWPYDFKYFKGLFAAIIAMLFGIISHSAMPQIPMIIDVGLTGIIILIVFIGVLYVLGLEDEDRELLTAIRQRLPRQMNQRK
jgi:O-antigen/teichoic acid export membrane protein